MALISLLKVRLNINKVKEKQLLNKTIQNINSQNS